MTGDSRRSRRPASTKPATIREIAKEAGVSIATVSRVFNDPETVRPSMRTRVMQVIDRHHYVSDGLAGGLSSRRSRLIGLIIPTVTNSIYASSTQAIQKVAQDAGYTVLVGISDFIPEQETELIHQLIGRRVEGLILTGAERAPRVYEKLRRNGTPFVITWKLARGSGLPCVSFDNHRAAAAAVAHLVSLGHRRIGLICGQTAVNDRARGRREGFFSAMAKHGLPIDPSLVLERNFEFVEGRAAMRQMLLNPKPPTAVFCANDILAIGALAECPEQGYRVPEDISIIGFDDLPIAQYTTPQLTTIRVPASEMGRRAAEALLHAIRNGEQHIYFELPTELVVRGSTALAHKTSTGRAGARRTRPRSGARGKTAAW
jgi:LacI family transcriptional regulator